MIGYKAFDEDLKCRGFQFEVGKTYETGKKKEELRLCEDGVFHFCMELHKIEHVSGYKISDSRICEVIAEGDIVTDGNKYGTNRIKILREIPREELNRYNNGNSGNWNSGEMNSGNWNSGDWNSGNRNSGNRNSGEMNSGNWNSGNWNSGNGNSGEMNSGNWNSGNRNSGNWNSGEMNSGNWNSGDWNSGNWNSGNRNSGLFNSDEPPLRIFNAFTDVKKHEIELPAFLYFDLDRWISHDTATDEEKKAHKAEIETCGGFLKEISYKEAFRIAWDSADLSEHEKLLKLPNWNNEIFKEISGIDAEAEIANERENGGY